MRRTPHVLALAVSILMGTAILSLHTTTDPHQQPLLYLWLHHNGDWSGDVIINAKRGPADEARSWTVDAAALISGRVQQAIEDEIPLDVLMRAVALAAVTFTRQAIENPIADLIDRAWARALQKR
jgi:hypothetical protein